MSPCALIPNAVVNKLPGTSMEVIVPCLSRKPCPSLLASVYDPTISPAGLMPQAIVPIAPGTSMVVKAAENAGLMDALTIKLRPTNIGAIFIHHPPQKYTSIDTMIDSQ